MTSAHIRIRMPMYNLNIEPKTLLPISEHEEKVWMQQLQDPQSIEWRVVIYTIDKNSKIDLIDQSIEKLVLNDMQLNLRFGFSEDFELEKWHLPDALRFLEVKQVTYEEIYDLTVAMKTRSWEAESQPPFEITVLQTEQEQYLCMSIHPILDEHINRKQIISLVEANYEELNNQNPEGKLSPTALDLTQVGNSNGSNGDIEQIILTEFKSSLDDPDVELDDDFFEIGGHSLLATRIIGNLMNNHGIEISFNDFFKSPSAQALALCVNQSSPVDPQEPAPPNEFLLANERPLSLAQTFLWDAHIATGKCAIFNLPFAIRFDAEVDEEIFKLAFNDLLIRHTGLRTVFIDVNGTTEQRIIDENDLAQCSWFWGSEESEDASLKSEAGYVFDLSKELPLRIRFFRDKQSGQQILSFLIHHMIIDEWSLNNLMPELSHAYLARIQDQQPVWDRPANSIHEYAIAQRSHGPRQEDIRYWVEHLQGATAGLNLIGSQPEQDGSLVNSIAANWVEIDLGTNAHRVVSSLARECNSSTFSVVYSAIAQALHHAGNIKDLVIGTSASGRDDAKYFDSVGYFTTMVAHRVVFKPEQPFTELVGEVTQTINDSMSHATVPIDLVQRELGLDPKNGLLFDVYAQIHADNALYGSLQKPQNESVSYQQILPNKTESLFGLHFEIMENLVGDKRSLRLIVTYQTARYSKEQIIALGQQMKSILTCQTVFQPEIV